MPEQTLPHGAVAIASSARPKQVAFFVRPETADREIDQIISYCLTCWGGRFHAIFPTDGDTVPTAWWKALVWHDPDVVYSFTPLHENLIRRINRHILPTDIIAIGLDDRSRLGEDNL